MTTIVKKVASTPAAKRSSDEGVVKASVSDTVADIIRQEILRGEVRPNVQLSEADLAERFQTSRTPIRQSLQRLVSEGLVIYRRRRWIVVDHTANDVREMYQLRAALEGYAARLAAENATDDDRRMLLRLRDLNDYAAANTPEERVSQNSDFHSKILELANNSRIIEAVERTVIYYFSIRVASLYTPERIREVSQEHQNIVTAICAGDGDAAERQARDHVLRALDDTLSIIF